MAINRFWLNPFCEESFLWKSYQNGMLGVNRSVPSFCSRDPNPVNQALCLDPVLNGASKLTNLWDDLLPRSRRGWRTQPKV
jgi:hypothetical protein